MMRRNWVTEIFILGILIICGVVLRMEDIIDFSTVLIISMLALLYFTLGIVKSS